MMGVELIQSRRPGLDVRALIFFVGRGIELLCALVVELLYVISITR